MSHEQSTQFRVVLKIFRNRRLIHTNFYFDKKSFKCKKLSLTHEKKNIFQFSSKNAKLKGHTRKILKFHIVVKIRRNRRLTHTIFFIFSKNTSN